MTPEIQPYAAISKDPLGLPNESNSIAGLGIFASILDHVGVLVVVFDTAGRIVYWNRPSAQFAGRRLDEAMRVPFWDWLLPEEERGVRAASLGKPGYLTLCPPGPKPLARPGWWETPVSVVEHLRAGCDRADRMDCRNGHRRNRTRDHPAKTPLYAGTIPELGGVRQ